MTDPVRFELVNSAPARTREMLDDPRGWAGETVWYGDRGSSLEARLTIMAKLPAVALGDRQGITATDDGDAAGLGINHLFDAVSFRLPRKQVKSDMDRYYSDHLSFATWSATTVKVGDALHNAFGLRYADAAAYVADVGSFYLILVTVPPVETPAVRQIQP